VIAPRRVTGKKAGKGRKAGIDGFGRFPLLAWFCLRAVHDLPKE